MNIINPNIVNPAYVQIGRKEAAAILGISPTELDRLRKTDPRCPVGFKKTTSQLAPVKFRLSDVYTYSVALMSEALPASSASR